LPQVRANGMNLEYEASGPPDGPPLLMIHGLGAQLTRWPQVLCDAFAAAGFLVIRYDSRDVGLSTHLEDAPIPDLAVQLEARRRGQEPDLPYTVSDLARDAAGLLAALGVQRAHVFGVSLGGQVAQALATEHPERVLSLAVMMSHASNPDLAPDSTATKTLIKPPPSPFEDEKGFLANAVAVARGVGGTGYPMDEKLIREGALKAAQRSYYPAGTARQFAAGRCAPDRRPGLRGLVAPTIVIHGADDPLVPLAAGEDIARNVKRSLMLAIDGMGHDLPPQLFDTIVAAIAANSRRSLD
jgi:pimeloyl-ACP methyl ester carboxylesterase